ncbi:MAG TPA: zinc dependent phospholipase C family protein [Terriglobia bacterium]|nr:zinc dependent phospholipase C family protein [Terriglobia bacterium]
MLSHEALVDAAWNPFIVPLLLKRFPGATAAELREAHAYAYGGSVIQDMGYYPFGNRFFSNLAHYVRGGDFIEALLRDSQNVNDYAFALGALSHYVADNNGHPIAVNLSVPDMYPKLRRKYGKIVTYEDDPKAHIMVEFSFDVAEIAGAGYLPQTYTNFIGFEVPKPLLEWAFQQTYGLNFKDLFLSEDLAIGTYRRGASEIVPRLTQIAWKEKKSEIRKADRKAARRQFVYRLSRRNYERQWGSDYQLPKFFLHRMTYRWEFGARQAQMGLLARILVFVFELLPKIGPLRTLTFKPPTPKTQKLVVKSFNDVVSRYEAMLTAEGANRLDLEEKNFDTGKPTQAGAYQLADQTYAQLLNRLASQHFKGVTPELRNNILAFYANLNAPISTKENLKKWQEVLQELTALKSTPITAAVAK